jgi:hypothetical protein
MLNNNLDVRKLVIWCLAIIIALFAAFKLYSYFMAGTIVATTSSTSNYVKIDRVTNGGGKPYSKQAQHKLSVRVKPGTYSVTVYNSTGQYGKSAAVQVKARQKVHISLDPPATINPEPVYGSSAESIIASNSQLFFIDTLDHLNLVDANGIHVLFPDHNLKSISWSTPGVGVAQDNNNRLYTISGSSIKPLPLPFNTSANKAVSYDVATDGKVYVNDGPDIYVGGAGGGFKKIYSAKNTQLGLVAGADELAVVERQHGTSESQLDIINGTGKVTQKRVPAGQVIWSPNDKYILVSGEHSNTIYDKSLNRVGAVPINNSGVFAWRTDTELFYSIDSQLWTYDMATKQSQKITALAAGEKLTGIFPNTSGSYVYFTDNNGEKAQLFRAGMNGQHAPNKSFGALSIFLPETIGVCSLNYVNFIKPVITIDYPSSGTDPKRCIEAAKGELKYYRLNANAFQYMTNPVNEYAAD